MTPPVIQRRSLLAGTRGVAGPTAVIDTFRAFSTSAYLFSRGVTRILLTDALDEARSLSRSTNGSLLCGEDGGRRPGDFDLGNSPTEVEEHPDLDGRVVVMRTSSGTRCVVSVLRSGAGPVYAASLVVAGATASALARGARATIVASGLGGISVADEDEETGDLLSDRILGRSDDADRLDRIRSGAGARRLTTTPWIDPDDLDRCLAVDRFGFAMVAESEEAGVVLRRQG